MGTQIRQINDHSFPSLHARLQYIEDLEYEEDYDPAMVSDLMEDVLKEATGAYIKYETANVQKQMQPKGIKVFAVSALAHITSRKHYRNHVYGLDEETAGIHDLRRFLAKLSAATNYQNYYDHVYDVLPGLRNEAARPLEQHLEDKTYAAMRRELKQHILELWHELKCLSRGPLDALMDKTWSGHEE